MGRCSSRRGDRRRGGWESGLPPQAQAATATVAGIWRRASDGGTRALESPSRESNAREFFPQKRKQSGGHGGCWLDNRCRMPTKQKHKVYMSNENIV
jgi:hypothetical protein